MRDQMHVSYNIIIMKSKLCITKMSLNFDKMSATALNFKSSSHASVCRGHTVRFAHFV